MSVLGTAQEQLGVLLGDESVPATYAVIMAMRCRRCGAGAGVRCRTTSGQVTYPHTTRAEDAVSAVAYLQRQAPGRLYLRFKGEPVPYDAPVVWDAVGLLGGPLVLGLIAAVLLERADRRDTAR